MISQTNLSILLHFKIQLTIYDSLKLITNVFFGVKNDLKKKKWKYIFTEYFRMIN